MIFVVMLHVFLLKCINLGKYLTNIMSAFSITIHHHDLHFLIDYRPIQKRMATMMSGLGGQELPHIVDTRYLRGQYFTDDDDNIR